MARKPRIHFPGALYHVIIRGNARQDIFFDDADRYRFYLLMQEGTERYGHRILAFCLMTNHIHLAIQVGDAPLSRIMQNLSFRYTLWINRKLNRTGHLFQGRYKAVLVDADSYLLELIAYIHLNPVRAGMVIDSEMYPWSSHKAYLCMEVITWLNTEYVLNMYSTLVSDARRQFSQFVTDRINDGHRDDFHGKGNIDSRIMGEEHFAESVHVKHEPDMLRKPTLDDIVTAVLKIYTMQENELAASGRKRLNSEARGMVAWAVLELSDATLTELSRRLNRDVSTLSIASRRFELNRQNDPICKERFALLKGNLELKARMVSL